MLCFRSCTATCTCKRFMALSFSRFGSCGRRAGAPAAAVLGEKSDQLVHALEVDAVDDEAAVLAAARKAGSRKMSEVERKRGGRQVQLFADHAGGQSLRAGFDQQPEHLQPRAMRQG